MSILGRWFWVRCGGPCKRRRYGFTHDTYGFVFCEACRWITAEYCTQQGASKA